jgi:hypothetical protein
MLALDFLRRALVRPHHRPLDAKLDLVAGVANEFLKLVVGFGAKLAGTVSVGEAAKSNRSGVGIGYL